jgi:hypothetical protein
MSPEDRRATRLGALETAAGGKLSYVARRQFDVVDGAATLSNVTSHEYSCEGARLFYRRSVRVGAKLPPETGLGRPRPAKVKK